MACWVGLYNRVVPVLQQLLQQNTIDHITDCCSGSGLPAMEMHRQLLPSIKNLQTKLTDLYPAPPNHLPAGIQYSTKPVDILALQSFPLTCYTMYNAFHHFSTIQQQTIVQHFASQRCPFFIAEVLTPGPLSLWNVLLAGSIGQLLTAPFIRPFSWRRLLFTYLIPVNIITVLYDGIISVFKSKTAAQYRTVLNGMDTNTYKIKVGVLNRWTGKLVYITGTPLNT
jgi:hypothetical protein